MNSTAALLLFGGAFLFLLMFTGGKFGERLVGWAFGAIVGIIVWAAKQPFRAVSAFLKTCLAWLHMEVKRWLGIGIGGIVVVVVASAIVKVSPPGSNWRLVALLICLFWLVAALSGARMTLEYLSIRRVRQSQAFREIHQLSAEAAKHAKVASTAVKNTAAERTKSTPAGRVFRSNRDAAAAEQEQERLAAEQAETERIAAAEQMARDQREAARRDRELEVLAQEHNPFEW